MALRVSPITPKFHIRRHHNIATAWLIQVLRFVEMNRGHMMIKQIPLGTQGFTTSEQGLGMMSVGITMGKQDLYGKKNDVSKKVWPNSFHVPSRLV